jgi:two-component sensor histidine kinase/tetratricopeptide (TPR) repeat protein
MKSDTSYLSMKYCICIVCFCLFSFQAKGQEDVDSLKNIVWGNQDTNAVLACYELGKKLAGTSLDSSAKYFVMGAQMAESLDYTKGKILLYRGLGSVKGRQGDYEEALSWLEKGKQLIQEKKLPIMNRVDFLINEGAAHYFAGFLGKAIEPYIEAVEICRTNGFDQKRGMLLNNLGIFYRNLDRFDEAIKIYEESYALRTEMKDTMGVANILFNMSAAYGKNQAYDIAVEKLDEALSLYRILKSEKDIVRCELSKGTTLTDAEKYQEALDVLMPLGKIQNLNLEPSSALLLRLTLAKLHVYFQDYNAADQHLNLIKNIVMESDFLKEKAEFSKLKADVMEGLGQFKEAHAYRKQFISIFEEKTETESQALLKEMETKYLTLEKDNEIALLNSENEISNLELKASNQRNLGLAIGIGLFGLLSFFLYRLYRQVKSQNATISKANHEKEILLKEIHHRVKNNLQVVSSLLGLQSRYVDNQQAHQAIQTGRARVQSMSLLHQNVYRNDNLKSVNIKHYFQELGKNLFENYRLNQKQIEFLTDIEDLELDIDIVVPMGLITNELISNALKYAFTDQEEGHIQLKIEQEGSDVVLSVSDNGKGVPFTSLPDRSESLGLQLIKSFSEKLNATVDISNVNGTSFQIRFDPGEMSVAA